VTPDPAVAADREGDRRTTSRDRRDREEEDQVTARQAIDPVAGPTTYAPAPRWAVRAAHLAALAPVPSSLWRLPLMFGVSMGMSDEFMAEMMAHPFWQRAGYLIALGVLSDGAAFLTLGLVRRWGEVFPEWLPWLGGRRVPPFAALLSASIGGLAVCYLFTWGLPTNAVEIVDNWDAWTVLMAACYAPIPLWGPLLLAVTWSYYRRVYSRV
jgi:hypothetical protein